MKREQGYRDPVSLDDTDLDTVELERTTDPMRAAMVRNILEGEGVVVSTPGYSVAAIRLAGIDVSIRVPKVDLDRSRAILAERGALSSKITVKTPRRWQLAMWVAFVPSFGCGHAHAGAHLSAALLCFAEIVALTAAVRGHVVLAGLAVLFPILGDLAGSRAACARANGSLPVRTWLSPGAMFGAALVPTYLVLMGVWGGALLAGRDGRVMCEMFERCGTGVERECLARYAAAELEGIEPFSPSCVRCVREERRCGPIVEHCTDLCGFE